MSKASETVGSNLKKIRLVRGLTQKEVAARLEVNQSYVSTSENGKSEPSFDYILKYAKTFGVSCDYIMGITNDVTGKMVNGDEIFVASVNELVPNNAANKSHKRVALQTLLFLYDIAENNEYLSERITDYIIYSVYKMFRILYDALPYKKALYSVEKDAAVSIADSQIDKLVGEISYIIGKNGGRVEELVNIAGDEFIKRDPHMYYCITKVIGMCESYIFNLTETIDKQIGEISK